MYISRYETRAALPWDSIIVRRVRYPVSFQRILAQRLTQFRQKMSTTSVATTKAFLNTIWYLVYYYTICELLMSLQPIFRGGRTTHRIRLLWSICTSRLSTVDTLRRFATLLTKRSFHATINNGAASALCCRWKWPSVAIIVRLSP